MGGHLVPADDGRGGQRNDRHGDGKIQHTTPTDPGGALGAQVGITLTSAGRDPVGWTRRARSEWPLRPSARWPTPA
jgi:hypothetical protein